MRLRKPWNELVGQHPHPEVFYLHEWPAAGRAWDDASACIVCAWEGERWLGALPLACTGRRLHFLAEDYADYNDLIAIPERCGEVAACLFDAAWHIRSRWRVLDLANIREDSLFKEALRREPRLARLLLEITAQMCPFIDLSAGKPERLERLLAKKSLVRHRKSLAKRGVLCFAVHGACASISPWLDEFFFQHVVRRAVAGTGSSLAGDRHQRTIRSLLQALSSRDIVRFSVLTLDGHPAAFHLGFVFAGKYYWYKPCFDVDLWSESPGEVLLLHLFESLAREPIRQFDFTIGNESFKQRFADGCITTRVFRSWRAGWVIAPCLQMAKRLQDVPWLRRMAVPFKRTVRWVARTGRRIAQGLAACGRWIGEEMRHPQALLSRIGRIFFARRSVLVFQAESAAIAAPLPPGWTVRKNSLTALARYGLKGDVPYRGGRLCEASERRRRGDDVYLVELDGRAVHVSWAGLRTELVPLYELGAYHRLDLNSAKLLAYDCWTSESARGRGIYPHMLRWIANEFRETASTMIIYCAADNAASIRGILKAGFQPLVEMRVTLFLRFIKHRAIRPA